MVLVEFPRRLICIKIQGVIVLHPRIRQIDGAWLTYYQSALLQLDALYLVLQRGQQGGELARQGVGVDIELPAEVGSGTTERITLDGSGVRQYRQHLVVGVETGGGGRDMLHHIHAVELVLRREHHFGYANVVSRLLEAHNGVGLNAAANDTTGEVDKCLVDELQPADVSVEGVAETLAVGVCRIAPCTGKDVSVFLDLHEVVANGYTDGELSVAVGGYHLTVLG